MPSASSAAAPPHGAPLRQSMSALRDSLLAEARSVAPLLAARADAADRDLRLADEVIEALVERRLHRLWHPRRYDGLEVDVTTEVLVTAELAKSCAATGWVTALYSACAYFTGLFSGEAQEEVFGRDPDARVCGVLAPMATVRPVEGGIRVDGSWPYASGSEHATWATVCAPRTGDLPGTDMLLIPLTDLKIEYSWDTTGMRGTASNTLHASDLFVPAHRVMAFAGPESAMTGTTPTEYRDEALYRSPVAGTGTASIVGPLLGIARASLAHTLDHVVDRPVAYTFATDQSALVSTQLAVAEAATKIDSGELHILRATGDLDDTARTGTALDLLQRARIRHDVCHGVQCLREAIDLCQQVNGSGDMSKGRVFERLFRDFVTANVHAALSPATTAEVYGKVLCGHDPLEFSALV